MEALHKRTLQPDCHDHRDHQFCDHHGEKSAHYNHISCPIKVKEKVAEHTLHAVDLRKSLTSEIINQGLLNSCSACAIAVAAELYLVKDNQPFINENISNIDASQMFVYYNERVLEDKVDLNAPVFIRDGIKSLFKNGICSEVSWPYPESTLPKNLRSIMETGTIAEITAAVEKTLKDNEPELHAAISEKPSAAALTQAKKHIINRYCKLTLDNGLADLKLSLSKDFPVIFGMMVPRSFYSTPASGVFTMPKPDEIRLGGHALLAVGYDDEKQHFIVRNSWGEEFGDKGYCYIPYEFFTGKYQTSQTEDSQDNAFSFWCLTHE
ncbi:MAG: C1 family peptidase [Colwellia sp.]|nr:C1 family peptidase [Colwellia sp.]